MRGVLVVFAKAPVPGRVKTRMTPPFTPEQAAGLYACMLRDVLEVSAEAARALSLDAVLALDPPEACAALARDAPPAFRVIAQRGSDLAQRMSWAVREAAAGGAQRVLLRGSDNPALDLATLAQALASLDDADLCAVPDRDGGYGLVGLRRPVPGLFAHRMSTRRALADTLSNAAARSLRARVLEPGFDLDSAEDLEQLARLRAGPAALLCRRTLAYLDERRLWRPAGGARAAAPGCPENA